MIIESEMARLLAQWEQNYKRGLLSFWILLSLNEQEMYPYEMSKAIKRMSNGTIDADDNSIYRALKRFSETKLVKSRKLDSDLGPPRRYFTLTEKGKELLKRFVERNILIFQQSVVLQALEHVIGEKTNE